MEYIEQRHRQHLSFYEEVRFVLVVGNDSSGIIVNGHGRKKCACVTTFVKERCLKINWKYVLIYKELIFIGDALEERRGRLCFFIPPSYIILCIFLSKFYPTSYHLEQVMDFVNERKSHGNVFNEIRTKCSLFIRYCYRLGSNSHIVVVPNPRQGLLALLDCGKLYISNF